MADTPARPSSGSPATGALTPSNSASGSKSPDSKSTPYTELGTEGLFQLSGYVFEEFLPALRGDRALRAYREMGDNDPVAGALIFVLKMLVRQIKWSVEPHDDDESTDLADFIESCFTDMSISWEDTLSQIMTMVQFGFAYHEIVYKKRQGYQEPSADPDALPTSKFNDGKIGWRKIPARAQETRFRWDVDPETRSLLGMWQRVPGIGQLFYVPIEKALLFRTQADKGNPEGRSILRSAYRPWYFKRRIEELEAIGVERDLAGLPIAYVPYQMMSPDATPNEQAALAQIKEIVRTVKTDEQQGLVFPAAFDERGNRLYELQLLSSGGRRQFDTNEIITRYNQQILMTALADFMLLGHEKVGSLALGATKVDVFTTALEAWVDSIADVFNTHAIPRLLRLNSMDVTRSPKLVFQDVQKVDIEDLAKAITAFAQAGMPLFPDENLENHVRDILNFPPRPPEMPLDTASGNPNQPEAQFIKRPAPDPTKGQQPGQDLKQMEADGAAKPDQKSADSVEANAGATSPPRIDNGSRGGDISVGQSPTPGARKKKPSVRKFIAE